MRFRTEYIPSKGSFTLDPRKKAVLIGSCFADSIGRIMRLSLWDASVNPCGTLFNPASMARVMQFAIDHTDPKDFWKDDDGIWRSWDLPSQFAGLTADECALKCSKALSSLAASMKSAETLIATFGTSIVYSLYGTDRVVANCHKQPARIFHRTRMKAEEIVSMWHTLLTRLREINPSLKIILTVSPVRHVKEGFTENSRSKATLLLACEELCRSLEGCEYFPAYEILTDDLRDYRFYASDMIHPSTEAEEYIFSRFTETFLRPEEIHLLDEGRALTRRARHRSLIPESESAGKFDHNTRKLILDWIDRNPEMLTPDRI